MLVDISRIWTAVKKLISNKRFSSLLAFGDLVSWESSQSLIEEPDEPESGKERSGLLVTFFGLGIANSVFLFRSSRPQNFLQVILHFSDGRRAALFADVLWGKKERRFIYKFTVSFSFTSLQ